MTIDTCVENFSAPFSRLLQRLLPYVARVTILAGMQDEIRLKNRRRRQWQITREHGLRPEVNRLQILMTRRLNEWMKRPVERDTRIPRSQRPIAVEDDVAGDESSYSIFRSVTPWGGDRAL